MDVYLCWLLRGQPEFLGQDYTLVPKWSEHLRPLAAPWERWANEVQAATGLSGSKNFQVEGGPLHPTGHSGEGGKADPTSSISVISRSEWRAVFLTSTMEAWYFDLDKQAKKLDDIGQRALKVDVIVRPVGFLGTFRRPSVTGLWFTGRHRNHTPGN
ncbi:hypothetical protein E3T43_17030 [Cryobacterium sp. Hh7]|uniref:hypothetical protein n=1 Tax=Cryobacterium sp. Hh7 TaxID=1259159 RepID=UPI00106A4044|nr:hypothetical protein [Cryobacterium sp. Hh7]TFD51099.1 hypothetical protein E3T43_17030 [Cryobacterium sp. Hh7]